MCHCPFDKCLLCWLGYQRLTVVCRTWLAARQNAAWFSRSIVFLTADCLDQVDTVCSWLATEILSSFVMHCTANVCLCNSGRVSATRKYFSLLAMFAIVPVDNHAYFVTESMICCQWHVPCMYTCLTECLLMISSTWITTTYLIFPTYSKAAALQC